MTPQSRSQVDQVLLSNPHWTPTKIATSLGLSRHAVRGYLVAKAEKLKDPVKFSSPRTFLGGKSWPDMGAAVQSRQEITDEISRDTRMLSGKSTANTLEEFLMINQVDLSIWEVDRHVIRRYETAMREPATTVGGAGNNAMIVKGEEGSEHTLWTRGSKDPIIVKLSSITVWLKRRAPLVSALESLIADLRDAAPLFQPIKPRVTKKDQRRMLEICVMDPHIGMLCQRPEGDEDWDMDKAANTIRAAMDDLIERARHYGPFEQVVMPFGNDFIHCDGVFHTTTAGTGQPEAISWLRTYRYACDLAIEMVQRALEVADKVFIYQIPGNHSRQSDFTMSIMLAAYFHHDPRVTVDCSSSPYKFHRYGVNLIGYEHGHSVKPIRLAALMAQMCPRDWSETFYREFHVGDQHRKGSSKPSMLEEQGVSVEYIPGVVPGNEWHKLKSFNHQKRGAMSFIWNHDTGPEARMQYNIITSNYLT